MNRKRNIQILALATIIMLGGRQAIADFTFGEPENLGPTLNTSFNEGLARISSDGLSLYFTSDRPGGFGNLDLYVSTRATIQDQWVSPVNLGPIVNSSAWEYWPSISADGLTLSFCSDRPGGQGKVDLWQTTRPTINDEWGPVENLGLPVNTPYDDTAPFISADGLELYFASYRTGIWDLYVSKRATKYDKWSEPVNLVVLNSAHEESGASLSADGLTLFLHSTRPGGFGDFDLYIATRETKDSDWSPPVNLGPQVNTQYSEFCPSISYEGHTLYFCDYPLTNMRPSGLGGGDIWQVSVLPIVDFNADGIVDATDVCIMVDCWSEDYSLCDIGPTPFGDGIVDVQDLIVLAEHMFEEIPPIE